jgi:hypothetical protein
MSDTRDGLVSALQRLLGVAVDPKEHVDAKALESIEGRLFDLENQIEQISVLQNKQETDITSVGTTAAMLLKSILRLTIQTQILYDRLGLDLQEEIARAAGAHHSHIHDDPDDPDDSGGGGMGGMLN